MQQIVLSLKENVQAGFAITLKLEQPYFIFTDQWWGSIYIFAQYLYCVHFWGSSDFFSILYLYQKKGMKTYWLRCTYNIPKEDCC